MDSVQPEQSLSISRELAAPPDVVWKYWTEPDLLQQWHAQENCDIPMCRIDLRVGGRHFMCVRGNRGTPQEWNTYCGWTFTEIVPGRRLRMLGFFADKEGNEVPASHYGATTWVDEVNISVELEPYNGGTWMTYKETVLPIPLQDKWLHQMLDQLAALIRSANC